MTTIAENIERLSAQIRGMEQQYGRDSDSVKLLAVSKRHSIESITQAYEAGIADFGENYLQESLDKIRQLSSLQLNWHFIGPVQANKTRPIAENFQWVHSVDRLKIAQRLNDQRAAVASPLNICVQVRLSDEASKSGLEIADVQALCDAVEEMPNLHLRGLMAIPEALTGLAAQRSVFQLLKQEFARLESRYTQFDTLSMGMSNDFEAAIAEGSTMIRIGTALFGPRE